MKERKFHRSYTKKIMICMIVASCLPVILSSILILRITGHTLQDSMEKQAISDLENIQEEIEVYYKTYCGVLKTLAESDTVIETVKGNGNINEVYSILYLLTSGYGGEAQFHIIDRKGKVEISTGEIPQDYQKPKGENWGVLRKAKSSFEPVLSTSDKSQSYNRNISFSIAMAIREDENVVGYVIVDVYRDVLENTVRTKISDYGYRVIVADSNNYVAFNSEDAANEGLTAYPKDLSKNKEGSAGEYTYTAEDTEYLVEYSESEMTGLQTVLYVPMTQLKENYSTVQTAIIKTAVPIVLAFMIIAAVITNNFTKPMRQLADTMREARKDRLSARVVVDRADEIGELGYMFNLLMEHIQDLIYNIEEKQKTLRVAQIQALCAQINPHFIYNTLDMIKWCGKMNDIDGVAKLTVQLGKLLRMTISEQGEYTTVEQDLEMLGCYIDIQKKRFAEQIQVEYHVDEELLNCRIPRIILQPLVENAIEHGFENKSEDCRIIISVWKNGIYLEMSVEDNGCGIPQEKIHEIMEGKSGNEHIGISNVKMRTELYGDSECGIQILSKENQGTKITLKILLKQEEECEKI